MTIIKYISGVIALAALMISTGCSSSFLDKTPVDSYTESNFYDSDEAVYASTAPLYNRAWFDYNNRGATLLGAGRANDVYSPYNWPSYVLFTVTALDENLSDIWKGMFSVVTMANATIDNLNSKCTGNVSEKAQRHGIAEARLMRGWAYYLALHVWGPVVLFEHNQDLVDNPVRPLNYEEDVFQFIINDLNYAAENLPETPYESGRATCWSAKAMLSKVYLSRAGWNKSERDANDLEKSKSYALDVINNSGSSLMENYHDLFKYRHNNNKESLLQLQWYKTAAMEWYVCNTNLSDLCGDSDMIGGVMCWSALSASADMLMQYKYRTSNGQEKWEKIRRDATFCTNGAHYDYINIAGGGYTYEGNSAIIKKGVPGGPDDDNDGYVSMMNSPLNTYVIRLADVYLTYAEACLGNQTSYSGEGLAYFNKVRERAGIEPLNSITFEDIVRERRVEFAMEMNNWYSLMTWYHWKPDYMLAYLNNQYRGYTYNGVIVGDNNELSFKCDENDWEIYVETPCGKIVEPSIIPTINSTNINLPYPEADVIQNPYLKEEPQHYNFSE
ncbi:MAG: RagB/SusD family nutrient uptake outer membrane protein [Muribaculaceae bacterium]|nr:RagB/SusD family nutrient uptake outer membrane protein [Muribaculaceae bacterium]